MKEKETSILLDSFDALLLYVRRDFSEEEGLFQDLGCSQLDEHKHEHGELEKELRLLWNNERRGSVDGAGRQLGEWVEQRLVPHMMEADQLTLKTATKAAPNGEWKGNVVWKKARRPSTVPDKPEQN